MAGLVTPASRSSVPRSEVRGLSEILRRRPLQWPSLWPTSPLRVAPWLCSREHQRLTAPLVSPRRCSPGPGVRACRAQSPVPCVCCGLAALWGPASSWRFSSVADRLWIARGSVCADPVQLGGLGLAMHLCSIRKRPWTLIQQLKSLGSGQYCVHGECRDRRGGAGCLTRSPRGESSSGDSVWNPRHVTASAWTCMASRPR